MKVLSILGMIFSLVLMVLSVAIADIRCYDEWGSSSPGVELAFLIFALSAFFLALSIVVCVAAFRKKRNGSL